MLFPLGHGLSYTTFTFTGLQVSPGGSSALVTVSNTESRAGRAVAELYASLLSPAGGLDRLVGWAAVNLQPNESREVTIAIEPLTLAAYDIKSKRFVRSSGRYTFHSGSTSIDLPAVEAVLLAGQDRVP